MIFGKTDEERKYISVYRFAWLPKQLKDGRWVWLQKYNILNIREGSYE